MDAPDHLLTPGSSVDHFEVIRLIGRGGMGEVYLARDTQLGRKVALKVVRPKALGQEQAVERFLHEAKVTARFAHPHIVSIHSVGAVDGSPYVALEYLEGQSLRERLTEGPLGPGEAMRIGLAVAEALAEAHRHEILHRDLKPENVFLPRDGRVRVLDFGLAKVVQREELETDDSLKSEYLDSAAGGLAEFDSGAAGVAGTPAYMAPEQWLRKAVTATTDVWALGLLLVEMATGTTPYGKLPKLTLCARVCAPDPVPGLAALSALPAEVADGVRRCLDKEPGERGSADELARVLTRHVHGGGTAERRQAAPFRGLLPFTERHADWFLGRDEEIASFVERLRGAPVLPVVGPSGAGKSSFVMAGVVPRLREQGRWIVLQLRPGAEPFRALATRLQRGDTGPTGGSSSRLSGTTTSAGSQPHTVALMGEDTARDDLEAVLRDSPKRLAYELQQLAKREARDGVPAQVLLFVDQLEELYTLVEEADARRAFMQAVAGAADDADGPVRVVFTLRDDFLVRLAETAEAQRVFGQLMVLRSPDEVALREIVQRPVERAGYRYEDEALVAEMIGAVRGELASLPLIQFACTELWRRRDKTRRVLTRAAYEDIGGVEGALAYHADGVLAAMTPAQVQLVRSLMLRLVTAEGTRRVVARTKLLEGLDGDAAEVLDRLIEARALHARKARKGHREDAEVELIHESLVRNWRRLAGWLDDSRDEVAFLAEVGQAAALWEQRGRSDVEVWRGDALRDAERRAQRVAQLPGEIGAFLAAGRDAEDRGARRQRWVVTGIIAGLVVIAAVLGLAQWEAVRQRRVAEEHRARAEAEGARAILESARADLEAGELLAARAKLRSSMEVHDSLHARALWREIQRDPRRGAWETPWVQTNGLAFSPDGSWFAVQSMDRAEVWLVDAYTQQKTHEYSVSEDRGARLEISSDGRFVAAANYSGDVWVLDRETGGVRLLVGETDRSWGIAFFPASTRLAVSRGSGAVDIWDAATGELLRRDAILDDVLLRVAVAPDGQRYAAAGMDGAVYVVDSETGQTVDRLEGHDGRIYGLDYSADGRLLASGGTDDTVRIWDLQGGAAPLVLTGDLGLVWEVQFSPDGTLLATGGSSRTLRLWDVASGRLLAEEDGVFEDVLPIAFSPDGEQVLAGVVDMVAMQTVRSWSVPALVAAAEAEAGALPPAENFDLSADGARMVWRGRGDDVARVMRIPGREVQATVPSSVGAVAISRDGETVATTGEGNTVHVWDVESGAEIVTFGGHRNSVFGLELMPDNRHLATASIDFSARLWDLRSGRLVHVFDDYTNRVSIAVASPDGAVLALGGNDATVRLHDVVTGEELDRTSGAAILSQIAFTADGATVVFGDTGDEVYTYDLGQRERRTIGRCAGGLASIAAHPTDTTVAFTCNSGEAKLLDLETGAERTLGTRFFHEGNLQWHANGRWLIGVGEDAAIGIHDVVEDRSIWHTSLLWAEPHGVWQRDGWVALTEGGGEPDSAQAWVKRVEADPNHAVADAGATTLCVADWDGTVELWNLPQDRRLHEMRTGRVAQLLAAGDRCVALTAAGDVQEVCADASTRRVLSGAEAIARGEGETLAVVAATVVAVPDDGEPGPPLSIAPGATAVQRLGDRLVLGFEDGSIALWTGAGERLETMFHETPRDAVEFLAQGPGETVIAGYRCGRVGLWSMEDGARLDQVQLHGAPVHRVWRGDELHVASAVGDHAVLDLSLYRRDAGELLEEVRREIPVVWEEGRVVIPE